MTEDLDKKGFSGLSSLASDVDEAAAQTRRKQEEAKLGGASAKASKTNRTQPASPPRTGSAPQPQSETDEVASGSSQGANTRSSGAKWFWGLVGAGGLIWLFMAVQEDGGRSTGNRVSTPSTLSPSYTQSTPAPTQPPALEFTTPPVGQNHVLSVAQIRWCVRKEIQIETLRPLTTTNAEVDQFNAIVADYNSRCGNFQYRRGTLDRARREVEQIRAQIVAGVRGVPRYRWSDSTSPVENAVPGGSSLTGPATTQPRPSQWSQLTFDVQSELKDLGYDPGLADGIYGAKTRAAIEAFQRRSGVPATGQVSQELLDRLTNAAASR